jgi:hypothetical protein
MLSSLFLLMPNNCDASSIVSMGFWNVVADEILSESKRNSAWIWSRRARSF